MLVGESGWTNDPAELEPHLTERREALRGATPIMVSPASTTEVAEVVRACHDAGVGVVPQGGNTGLCGGAIPDESGEQILLSLARMNKIRAINPEDFSMEVEAGCILAIVQQAAEEADRLFPLSLAAEGSCQIGGNLSTNAGGINVIRYGTARDQVLGLEVVLADGTILNGLRTLRKDTAGYDLKHLFLGSEGTLGIITAATLRLFPRPHHPTTALLALASARDAVGLLAHARETLADQVQAFELISARAMRFVCKHVPGTTVPFAEAHAWYVLLDADSGGQTDSVVAMLARAVERGVVADAVIAKNAGEAEALWKLRHAIAEAQKHEGLSLKHDVSVPIGRIDEFLSTCEQRLQREMKGIRPVVFGHVGDGNLHYNISQSHDVDKQQFAEDGKAITALIYELVSEMGGSISAEHGIGVLKKEPLARYRSAAEIALMKTLKQALDPTNTLNPGKVI